MLIFSQSRPVSSSSSALEHRNRRAEVVAIRQLRHGSDVVDRDHVRAGLGAQAPNVHVAGTVLDADHILLARFRRQAVLAVVIEEGVEPGAEDEDVRRRHDAQAPCLSARVSCAGAERRVGVCRRRSKRRQGVGVGLVVRRLGLDGAHVDVRGLVDLIVVQLAVLSAGAVHPDGALCALNQDAAAIENVDLTVVRAIELMIRHPEPVVLEVNGGLFGDMQEHVGADAGWVRRGGDIGVLGAGVALQARAGGATNAHVHVPHAAGGGCGLGDVPFDENSARSRAFSLKDEVTHLDSTGVAGLADLEDGLGLGLITEGLTVGHDQRPDLAGDLDVLWYFDGIGNEIGAVVKVDNLAIRRLVKNGLKSCGVIRHAVTLGTSRLDADKTSSGCRFVLRLRTLDNLALAIK